MQRGGGAERKGKIEVNSKRTEGGGENLKNDLPLFPLRSGMFSLSSLLFLPPYHHTVADVELH